MCMVIVIETVDSTITITPILFKWVVTYKTLETQCKNNTKYKFFKDIFEI